MRRQFYSDVNSSAFASSESLPAVASGRSSTRSDETLLEFEMVVNGLS